MLQGPSYTLELTPESSKKSRGDEEVGLVWQDSVEKGSNATSRWTYRVIWGHRPPRLTRSYLNVYCLGDTRQQSLFKEADHGRTTKDERSRSEGRVESVAEFEDEQGE
jgi:hypothetical protein